LLLLLPASQKFEGSNEVRVKEPIVGFLLYKIPYGKDVIMQILKNLSVSLLTCLLFLGLVLAPSSLINAETETKETEASVEEALSEDALEARRELLASEEAKELREKFLILANEVEVTEDEVIFHDNATEEGVEHRIKRGIDQVAILYGSYTTLWYEAGGEAMAIIGGDNIKTYEKDIGRDITQDEGVEVVAETNSGQTWDVERIIASQPELIICSQAMSGYATISGPAEAAGIEVLCLSYDTFEDYLKWFKVFSHLAGEPERFEEVALKVLDEVILIILACPAEETPQVAILFASPRDFTLNTKATSIGAMVLDLKANNVVDDWDNPDGAKRLPVSLERLFTINPEKILVQTHTSEDKCREVIEENFGDNAVWNELDAVKNKELYILDTNLFHRKPNARFAEAYKQLAQILYPEVDFGLDFAS
jgi:ABC-type Fe3+-hydroxamate transport system substrate-binding protein